MADSHSHSESHAAHEPHACPMWILLAVFGALLVLTGITVFTATQIDLGAYNLLLAMAIALLKGALVALFFMHLWWDSLFNSVALIAGLSFLALFIGFSIVDTYQYEPAVLPLNQVLTPAKLMGTSVGAAPPAAEHVEGPPVPEIEEHRPEPAPATDEQNEPAAESESPPINAE